MDRFDGWLEKWSLPLSLILALGSVAALYLAGVFSQNVMPFGDGEHYLLRAFTLYGYLHTGQWVEFWNLFTLPRQSVAPLHYWLFFLVPRPWAGITSYGLLQGLTTYLLLALGIWQLCRALGRPAWAPALFILCAAQNISLDYSYFYFVDLPFYACGTIALAWQIRAWSNASPQTAVLSGLGAALLFWIKPANAIIFLGTYTLAEMVWMIEMWRRGTPDWRTRFLRHAAGIAVGFFPMTILALACGGLQSILRLIDANEASGVFSVHLECTGLVRLLYFPLCLTFFYHIGIILMLAAAVTGGVFLLPLSGGALPKLFPSQLLVPLLVAYGLFGEFFSLGMANKEMRSLLLVLPLFWLMIFWLTERWRVRPAFLFLAAAAYATCGYGQIFSDVFGTRSGSTQGYQLGDDWLERMPGIQMVPSDAIQLTQQIIVQVHNILPQGGKIAVGTEQLYVTSESLTWVLQKEPLLAGHRAPWQFVNFLDHNGNYDRTALVDASGLFVCVYPAFQYSPAVQTASASIVNFCGRGWTGSQGNGYAKLFPLLAGSDETFGFIIVPRTPLDNAHVTQLIQNTAVGELPPRNEFTLFNDRRLSWEDFQDILLRWKQKRLGK